MGAYLRSVVAGHMRYYAVPMNAVSVSDFRLAVSWICGGAVLKRRSQRTHLPWTRMKRHVARWLPQIRICHPYPWIALASLPKARAGCSNACTSGSVEGVMGDHDSYSDIFGFRICCAGCLVR